MHDASTNTNANGAACAGRRVGKWKKSDSEVRAARTACNQGMAVCACGCTVMGAWERAMAILSCLLAVGGLTAGAYREDEDADSAGRGAGSGHGADRGAILTGGRARPSARCGRVQVRSGYVCLVLHATRYMLESLRA